MSEFNYELADNYHRIYKRQDGLGLEIPTQVEVIAPFFGNTETDHCLPYEGINALPVSFDNSNSLIYENHVSPHALVATTYNSLTNSIYRTLVEELKTVGMKDIVISPTFMEFPVELFDFRFGASEVTARYDFDSFINKNSSYDSSLDFDKILENALTPNESLSDTIKTLFESCANTLSQSMYEREERLRPRRVYDFLVNKPSQHAVDTHKYHFDNQVIIAIGEDPDYFPFDFEAGNNTVFIWATPWKMKAPVVGKIPAGENIKAYLTKILPMCISEENDYTNFTYIEQSDFRSKIKEFIESGTFKRDNPDAVSLLNIFTADEPITLKFLFKNVLELRLNNRSITNYETVIKSIFEKFEDPLINIDLAERVSNMLAIASVIDLYSRKDNAGKVIFVGLLSQNAVSNIIEQMYEHMPLDTLPNKLTTKMTSLNKVNPMFNVIGAGGIGSVFGEFFTNYDFDTFTNFFASIVRNQRNRFRLAITDMDDIETHNLNRSSIFSFNDVENNRMKVDAIQQFMDRSALNKHFLTIPVFKVLSGPYTEKSRKELLALFSAGNKRYTATQANKGHVIDCRDVLSVDYTIEKTSLKLSYNGDKRLGFHFNLDRFIENLFIMPGSNYDVVPSFCVPPKFSVALGVLFVNIPFFEKYAAEYAELNVETLINNSSETIL